MLLSVVFAWDSTSGSYTIFFLVLAAKHLTPTLETVQSAALQGGSQASQKSPGAKRAKWHLGSVLCFSSLTCCFACLSLSVRTSSKKL